jgi:hypothetical protein
MADTVYRVLTVYDVDTRGAKAEVGSLAVVADHALSLLERGKEMISHVVELHSAVENATIAIAGLMSAGNFPGAKNFQMAMAMSSEIIQQMRKDAAALPGEMEDLQAIFQFGLLGGSQAGKSVNQVEQMSAQLMSVTKALGINSEFAGREFSELMEGRASSRITLFAKLKNLMGDSEMNAQKFNALSAPEKWERIQKALGSFGPMIDDYSKGWDATSSTTKMYAEQIIRVGSGAMFNGLKSALNDLNEWFVKNQPMIEKMVSDLGQKLAQGMLATFQAVKDVVAFIIDHKSALLLVAEAFAFGKATTMLGGLSGASGPVAAIANKAGSMAGGAGLGLALDALVGQVGTVNTVMHGLEGALMVLPGPLGLIAAALQVFHTALQGLANWIDDDHQKRISKEDRSDQLMGLYKDFEKNGLTDSTFAIAKNLAAQQHLFTGGPLDAKIDNARFGGYVGGLTNLDMAGAKAARNLFAAVAGRMHDSTEYGPSAPTAQQRVQMMLSEQSKAAKKPDMNVRVHIEQTINDAENSRRVLDMTKKALRESLEHPTRTFVAGIYR